jgi:cytidylate kinase
MTVIALAMESGSYDGRFGAKIAAKLVLQLVDIRSFERDIAEQCDVGDCAAHRLVDGETITARYWDLTTQQLVARIREQVLQTAAQGNALILGWSAATILEPIHHVARVRILAPLKLRELNVMRHLAYNDIGTARIEIESSDALIARFVRQTTNADWADPTHYDLLLNAASIPSDACIELIKTFAASRQFCETDVSRDLLSTELARLIAHDQAAATSDDKHAVDMPTQKVPAVNDNIGPNDLSPGQLSRAERAISSSFSASNTTIFGPSNAKISTARN